MDYNEYFNAITGNPDTIQFPTAEKIYVTRCPYCDQSQGRQLARFYPQDFGVLSQCPRCKKPFLLVALEDNLVALSILGPTTCQAK